jgi:3-hydroxyisobutyrate dehydrogenase
MTRIGFVGVGTMGLPMATNLAKKGFAVTAFDVNSEATRAAAAAGMTAAASAAEAVAGADVVVSMLPSSPHVEVAYAGDGGVLAAARRTLCVDMSTIDLISQRMTAAAAGAASASSTRRCPAGCRAPSRARWPSWWAGPGRFSSALPVQAMGANILRRPGGQRRGW